MSSDSIVGAGEDIRVDSESRELMNEYCELVKDDAAELLSKYPTFSSSASASTEAR